MEAPSINKIQTATEQGTILLLCYSAHIKISNRSHSTTSLAAALFCLTYSISYHIVHLYSTFRIRL